MTPRQRQCLEAIRRLTVDGVSPSYEDIRREMGLSSKGEINRLIYKLRERGLVNFIPGVSRSVVLIDRESPAIERIADAVARRFIVPIDAARAAVLEGWAA